MPVNCSGVYVGFANSFREIVPIKTRRPPTVANDINGTSCWAVRPVVFVDFELAVGLVPTAKKKQVSEKVNSE